MKGMGILVTTRSFSHTDLWKTQMEMWKH
uniref:Uncharacterized protein n=1 Tax=Arundo donax TaxID=35708 RepID=A0A0A9GID8_ARUDO